MKFIGMAGKNHDLNFKQLNFDKYSLIEQSHAAIIGDCSIREYHSTNSLNPLLCKVAILVVKMNFLNSISCAWILT